MLYIVATPIGNLEDITLRALRVLKEVDLILCEDTRQTKKLLDRYQIKTPLLSYHQHSKLKRINQILDLLKNGKKLALVSDAGTPGISDPGNKLINYLTEQLSNHLTITPIPGPSALVAALSISGFPSQKFVFLGWPPRKKGRKKFFQEIAAIKYPAIFYESPYRILKTLDNLIQALSSEREIVLARELTKYYETIYRGPIKIVAENFKNDKIKGEFVVIISPL